MRFSAAVDVYVQEMFAEGRFNSPATEENYRATLAKHAEDVGNRDPKLTNRDDVKGDAPGVLRLPRGGGRDSDRACESVPPGVAQLAGGDEEP